MLRPLVAILMAVQRSQTISPGRSMARIYTQTGRSDLCTASTTGLTASMSLAVHARAGVDGLFSSSSEANFPRSLDLYRQK